MADAIVGSAAALVDAAAAKVKSLTDAGEVDNRVIGAMIEERIARRTDLLSGAVKARKAKVKSLAGIKPANQGFQEDGTAVPGTTFTGCQVEKIKSLKKEIEELDAAIQARDFDKLSDLGY